MKAQSDPKGWRTRAFNLPVQQLVRLATIGSFRGSFRLMANGAGIEKIYLIAAVTLILAAGVVPARAADLAGRVFDQSGAGVANVQVSVNNHDGKQIAVATSNATGDYSIHDIAPGTYSFHARGQSAVAYLGDDGLTINWGLVPNLPPIASARPGVATDDGEDRALGAQN